MIQEEKQLLVKDLSARLPCGVLVHINGLVNSKLTGVYDGRVSTDRGINYPITLVKPYLRPMESMTEEEKDELEEIVNQELIDLRNRILSGHYGVIRDGDYHFNQTLELDFLIRNHFDYRGLIPKGLALPAKESMYN